MDRFRGYVEYNETAEGGAMREVQEERCLKVKPIQVIGVYSNRGESTVSSVGQNT